MSLSSKITLPGWFVICSTPNLTFDILHFLMNACPCWLNPTPTFPPDKRHFSNWHFPKDITITPKHISQHSTSFKFIYHQHYYCTWWCTLQNVIQTQKCMLRQKNQLCTSAPSCLCKSLGTDRQIPQFNRQCTPTQTSVQCSILFQPKQIQALFHTISPSLPATEPLSPDPKAINLSIIA